jgi:hypothetical protein
MEHINFFRDSLLTGVHSTSEKELTLVSQGWADVGLVVMLMEGWSKIWLWRM